MLFVIIFRLVCILWSFWVNSIVKSYHFNILKHSIFLDLSARFKQNTSFYIVVEYFAFNAHIYDTNFPDCTCNKFYKNKDGSKTSKLKMYQEIKERRKIPEGHSNSNIENKVITPWLNKADFKYVINKTRIAWPGWQVVSLESHYMFFIYYLCFNSLTTKLLLLPMKTIIVNSIIKVFYW